MSSAVDASSWLYSFKSETTALNLLKNKYPLKRAKTVAISSGKGGVGKTSISVKLGQELATQGYKVLLLDCDFNLSNTSIKLNLPLSNNFYDLVTGKRTFEDCLIPMGGLDILPSLNGNLELFNDGFQMYEVIVDIIIAHEANYDYILLDCPAGVSRDTISLNAYCENRVVVVTPDKSSITDSYSLIKILAKNFGVKENHLVINMVNNLNQYNRVVQTMSETAENYLNVRTQVIGGLKKYDFPSDQFDKKFLSRDKSAAHKDFTKLAKSFTEKICRRGDYQQTMMDTSALMDVQ